jgi:hypothetical protein
MAKGILARKRQHRSEPTENETMNILRFNLPMPPGDPFNDIGDNEALVRRAEAGQAEALSMIFSILELDGRHDWLLTEIEVLRPFGVGLEGIFRVEDGALVARIARTVNLRKELMIVAHRQVISN